MQGSRIIRFLFWLILPAVLAACGGGGGGGSGPAPAPPPAPAPTVFFSALPGDVASGSTATLTWSSTNASSCTASGGWTGTEPTSGTATSPALTATTTYTLTCTGSGGTAAQSATVILEGSVPPDAPVSIEAATGDGSITVTWQSQTGTYFQGNVVTSNVYASTQPNINPATFVVSSNSQVIRGLTTPHPIVFSGWTNGTPVYVVATDVANGHESAAGPEVSVTPQPIAPLVESIAALNDTGVIGCTDGTSLNQPCPQAALPNQDADVGRDAEARNGTLTKLGFGQAGFDFTKLDANGANLPNDAPTWVCIKDNTTGLTWEVPGANTLATISNLYTWYQPDNGLNGGNAGLQNGGSCTGSACDTYGFLAALNGADLCGFQDWRLPTRRELLSIVDYGTSNPAFDISAFPNQPNYYTNSFFWTSTVHSGTADVGIAAWILYISTGIPDFSTKVPIVGAVIFPEGYVMAVR
jgi:hypothetical protein